MSLKDPIQSKQLFESFTANKYQVFIFRLILNVLYGFYFIIKFLKNVRFTVAEKCRKYYCGDSENSLTNVLLNRLNI